ncbi:MAG: ParB N-terminal domain-containing protein [Verrucomicrobiota bacterium]
MEFEYLSLLDVQEDCDQPRINIWPGDKKDMEMLESISECGILQPLIVSPVNGMETIIDGHRRFHVAKLLKFDRVPCVSLGEISKHRREVIRYKLNGINW